MKKDKTNKITNRFYLVSIGLFIFSLLLIFKLLYLQINEGEYYKELAQKRTLKNFELQASRGNIYSDDKSILATSVTKYEIRWDSKVPSKEIFERNIISLGEKLADLFGKEKSFYVKKMKQARESNNRYLLIANNLTFSQYKKMISFPIFNLPAFKGGVIVESKVVRVNPFGKIAERTIGYERKDASGKYLRVGLEGAYSQILRGENGRRLKQKIANGQWKPINDNNEKEPTEGYDLYSTINLGIQDIVHHELLAQLENYEADHGTAIVMETNSGDIKAISNLGRTLDGNYYEKLNYAIGESNEPGSTFKLISLIAALEDKVVSVEDIIDTGNGVLNIYDGKVKDSKKGGYGKITVSKAFEMSSNTGIVKIIYDNYKNNPENFVNRIFNIGINNSLDLPIKGEALPKIPHPSDSNWNGLSLPWMAFGYGILLTPIQILTFYNAIANNGEMVKPKFINRISGYSEKKSKVFNKKVLNPSICSNSTLKEIKKMMFNVVDKKWGTAYNIRDPELNISGKTGTCQVDYSKGEIQYISSFVGYFPSKKPIYSCIVVIHRPNKKKGYYGSQVAAPVFKNIAKKIFNRTPKLKEIEDFNLDDKLIKVSNNLNTSNQFMPNLKGMKAIDAINILEKMELNISVKGSGDVVSQSIPKGVKVISKQKIILELS